MFSLETGWKNQELDSLKVKKLLGCMELLNRVSDKLGLALCVRVRAGASKGNIMVGNEESAVRVGKNLDKFLDIEAWTSLRT